MKNNRKQNLRRSVAFLFTLILLFSMAVSSVSFAATDEEKARAKQQIDDIQSQINAKQKELDAKEAELKKAKAKTSDTENKLGILNYQSATLQEKIELLEEQLGILNDNLDATKKEEAETYALFCDQIRQEEERGTTSYWSVLFHATSFSDLLTRIDFVNEIMEYEKSIITKLENVRKDLEDQQVALDEQNEALDEAKDALTKKVSETSTLLKEYKTTQEGLQAEYDAIKAEEEALDDLMDQATANAIALGVDGVVATTGGYAWPLKAVRGVTSHFGGRASPGGVGSTNHKGIDLAASYCNVYAAKAGTVTWASWNGGYGNCVIIQHGGGNTTLYGHLSSYKVSVGDVVTQGQLIAVSGNTGASTGPHLHFGITEGGVWVDPLNYLTGWYWCGN